MIIIYTSIIIYETHTGRNTVCWSCVVVRAPPCVFEQYNSCTFLMFTYAIIIR